METDSLKRLICFDKEVARYTGQPAATQGAPATSASRQPAGAPAAVAPALPPPATSKPQHVSAHVVRIENFPDALVVHLDNDQVWEQIQEAAADLNLHTGDAVTIDREMGAYWLSGKNGAAMKVRQKK